MPYINLHTAVPQFTPSHHKGRLIGQKPPLKPREVWAIRIRLQIQRKQRDLALFNLAIDSKLRSCDLVALRISDVATGGSIGERAMIVQKKTGRPVQFELTEQTRGAVHAWITQRALSDGGYLFPSRVWPNDPLLPFSSKVWAAALYAFLPFSYIEQMTLFSTK